MRTKRIETQRHFDHKNIAYDGIGSVYFVSGTNNTKDDYSVECVDIHTEKTTTIYRSDRRIVSIGLRQGKDEIVIGIENKQVIVLDTGTRLQKHTAYLENPYLKDYWEVCLIPDGVYAATWHTYTDIIAIHDVFNGRMRCSRNLKDTFADMDDKIHERYSNNENYYKTWGVFFSKDSQYMVTVYTLQRGEKAFIDIWAIAQNEVLAKQSLDESFALSHTMKSQLERYTFSRNTIADMTRTYKRGRGY